jgi:hypothetical protein
MKLSQEEADILAAFEKGELHSIATPEVLKEARQSAQLTTRLRDGKPRASRHLKKA